MFPLPPSYQKQKQSCSNMPIHNVILFDNQFPPFPSSSTSEPITKLPGSITTVNSTVLSKYSLSSSGASGWGVHAFDEDVISFQDFHDEIVRDILPLLVMQIIPDAVSGSADGELGLNLTLLGPGAVCAGLSVSGYLYFLVCVFARVCMCVLRCPLHALVLAESESSSSSIHVHISICSCVQEFCSYKSLITPSPIQISPFDPCCDWSSSFPSRQGTLPTKLDCRVLFILTPSAF